MGFMSTAYSLALFQKFFIISSKGVVDNIWMGKIPYPYLLSQHTSTSESHVDYIKKLFNVWTFSLIMLGCTDDLYLEELQLYLYPPTAME